MRRYEDEAVDEDETNVAPRKSEAEILADLKSKFEKKRKKKLEEQAEHAGRLDETKGAEHDNTSKAELKTSEQVKTSKRRKKKRKQQPAGGEDDSLGKSSGFTVLGESVDQSRRKVRRVLPQWLANPDIVSVDFTEDQLPVEELEGLDEATVARLKANGVKKFFPVQRQVIPHLLIPADAKAPFRPSDVCVSAPTGSGKTLAFVLPIVQALKNRVVTRVRALVILPVQDLATQVYRVFQSFASGTALRVKLLTPQKSFAHEQNELVRTGIVGEAHSLADVIVATPGRLVDHIQNTRGFSLEHLRYLVIDEADRVMEDVQNDWLTHVEGAVYNGGRSRPGPLTVENVSKGEVPLQKLLFSATLSQNPEQLERLNLFEPKLYTSVVKPKDILEKSSTMIGSGLEEGFDTVGQYTTPAELREFVVTCTSGLKKPQILHHLLTSKEMKKVLVFTNSLEHTNFLSILLKEYGLSVGELSSQIGVKRKRMLNKFNSGTFDILVCSDALARGIDIGQIDYVISYDSPAFVKTYIHRVGRTARAGRAGTAITLVNAKSKEEKAFRALMREAGKMETLSPMEVDEDDLDSARYESVAKRVSAIIGAEKKDAKSKTRKGQGKK